MAMESKFEDKGTLVAIVALLKKRCQTKSRTYYKAELEQYAIIILGVVEAVLGANK